MGKKWEDAFKLCKFILMYEPDNEIAREYLPLIEMKLNQSESEDESDTDSSSDDDDDSDKGSDDDYDDESESTENSDEEENEEVKRKKKEKEQEEIRKVKELYKEMKPKTEEPTTRQSEAAAYPKNTKYSSNSSSIKKSK